MELNTVSYVLLGHLAMQPWSMYDLAAQMRRNVHYFFPRAESRVYAEPKNLVRLGLATSRVEMVGKRGRTIYEITEDGRAELRRWLATPISKGPVLEFEALVRVALSPFGQPEDLANSLQQVRSEIDEMLAMATAIRGEYLAGTAPFQRYVVHRSMLHDFLTSFAELVDDWAARSAERVRQWEDQSGEEQRAAAIAVIDAKPAPRLRRP